VPAPTVAVVAAGGTKPRPAISVVMYPASLPDVVHSMNAPSPRANTPPRAACRRKIVVASVNNPRREDQLFLRRY